MAFDVPGLAIFVGAFRTVVEAGPTFCVEGEGPAMVVAGPPRAAADLAYRTRAADPDWYSASGGASCLFLPLWVLELVRFVLGIVYTATA